MKNIKNFKIFNESYATNIERDRILDKISSQGIDSITKEEKDFLDSFKSGKEEEQLRKQDLEFEDGSFYMKIDSIEEYSISENRIVCNLKLDTVDYINEYHGEIILEDERVNHFSFSPYYDLDKIEIIADPYKVETLHVYYKDYNIIEYNGEEALKMHDLYNHDREKFNEEVQSILWEREDEDIFIEVLEELNITVDFYEFIEMVTGNL